jgi:hypothetical protein
MRTLKVLNALLQLIFIFSIIGLVAVPLLALFVDESSNLEVNILGYVIDQWTWPFRLVLWAIFLSQCCYVGMIYYLKKASSRTYQLDQLLAPPFPMYLRRAGWCCLIGVAFYYVVPILVFAAHQQSRLGLSLNTGFGSVLLVAAFGLFLLAVAKIMQLSIAINEENKLTI